MIPQPALRLSYIILSITLTAILISSPIIAVYSPSMVLKVGFTSAYATSENDGDEESNTDATTTTDDTEGQHQQVPPPEQHQQVPGTTTSPHSGGTTTTTPPIPDDDSTETPSTDTTTTVEIPPGSEDTPSDATSPQSPTDTSSQQGGQPSSGLPTPFNAVPPQAPPTDTSSQGGQQGQGQQSPLPQGPVRTEDFFGKVTTRYPGDIEITTTHNGDTEYKYPGGRTILFSDGSILNMPEDGKSTIIRPPGTMVEGWSGYEEATGTDPIGNPFGFPLFPTRADWFVVCYGGYIWGWC